MSQNALVRLIYEAVDDPLLWDAFLAKFAEAVHAETAGLCTEDKAGKWGRNIATVGMDPASRKSYEEYFISRDPWQGRRKMFAGNVETGEQLFSNRELVKTEFYNDFLKPNGWLYECSTVTNVETSTFSRLFTLRPPRSGAFTSEEIGLCSYLAPHLETAARIRQRIVDLEATVDRLVVGEMDTHRLAKLSLTPAETRLAIALFQGQSVEAYAKEAGVSINTARWYVKRIYAKTGVRRQTELIRLLLKTTARI
ncbi:MAG TPA: helix-turn-helix transcriptional regulator [Bryobacteraceae bacterium]|nr:helix-turn-helix transcriptional regulator [Bryobacteraceae bacterium]